MESGYDCGRVNISTDDGKNWSQIDRRTGFSDWRQTVVDLSSYAGQTIKLGFHFTSDYSITNSGWYIDAIQITYEESEPLTTTLVSLNHQKFPFIYMNVAADTFGVGVPELTEHDFQVYENGVLQTNYFEVTPPEVGGEVRLADIVFVLDVTGSMADEIEAVRQNMLSFVEALVSSGINCGIGFVVFGDIIYTYNDGNMYYQQSEILSIINNIQLGEYGIGSGGDGPENQIGAMAEASPMNYRPGAQKIQIMLTDANAHEADWATSWTVEALIDLLKTTSITVFPVFDTGDYTQQAQYIPIAEAANAGGTYYHIYDNFNSIVDEIQSQIANTYVIRYKSSNPVADGTLRNVEVKVSYDGHEATCTGSYIPGSAPYIQRTELTLNLHDQAWPENTEFTIEADIIDNVEPYVQGATLYYRKTGTAAYASSTMSLYSENTYRGVIPGSAVGSPGLDYYITATDGQNTSSDPSVDPANNPHQIAILSNVAPAITHTPVTTLTPGTPITIAAEIVDNTNSVALAKLYYRKTGQLLYQNVDLSRTSGNNYAAEIPSGYVTADGTDYYLFAEDDFGVGAYSGTPDSPYQIQPQETTPTDGTLSDENICVYPNPFNPDREEVTIAFTLAEAGDVSIEVYDMANSLVATVVSELPMEADIELSATWDGTNDIGQTVANGVYFCFIESSSGEMGVGKIAVLR